MWSSVQANGHGPPFVPRPQPIGRQPAAPDGGRKADFGRAGPHGNGLGYGRSAFEAPGQALGPPQMPLSEHPRSPAPLQSRPAFPGEPPSRPPVQQLPPHFTFSSPMTHHASQQPPPPRLPGLQVHLMDSWDGVEMQESFKCCLPLLACCSRGARPIWAVGLEDHSCASVVLLAHFISYCN